MPVLRRGRDIAAERRRYKITQLELAKALGTNTVVLAVIENEKVQPTFAMLQAARDYIEGRAHD